MCIFAPAIGAKKCSMCHLKTANKQIYMYKENKNLNRIKVVLAEKSAKQVSGQADWPRPSHWDLGSGTRNILRYAPLYYPDYKIEINSSTQFLFSITSQDENVPNSGQMSPTEGENVPDSGQMSPTNVPELTDEELSLKPFEREIVISKRNRRKQAIIGIIAIAPHATLESMAEKLDVGKKTIKRDIKDLREAGVIKRVGGNFGGEWRILKKK